MLEFVDEHGNEVLNLGSFTLLPQHVVRLIMAREELKADEFTKFQVSCVWSPIVRMQASQLELGYRSGWFYEFLVISHGVTELIYKPKELVFYISTGS